MKKNAAPELSFEQATQRMAEIIALLEKGESSLDESITLFEEGTRLSQLCLKLLESAEQKVEKLTRDANGEVAAEPFDTEDA